MSTDKTEPKGSASSSPDERCRCGHERRAHSTAPGGESCVRCPGDEERTWKHAFVPADAETAGEPECSHESWEVTGEHRSPEGWVKSRVCASCHEDLDNIIEAKPHWGIQSVEPEAPEELPPCRSCGKRVETWFDRSVCAEPCESMHDRCSACGVTVTPCPNMSEPEAPECSACGGDDPKGCPFCKQKADGQAQCACGYNPAKGGGHAASCFMAPSRPPFLVAYATGTGALNELALPGDATVAVLDGSLVISHTSGVLGIQHVRPLEGP